MKKKSISLFVLFLRTTKLHYLKWKWTYCCSLRGLRELRASLGDKRVHDKRLRVRERLHNRREEKGV